MNEVLKQRLVGALILVALGVVFWPIIFVEPGQLDGAQEARISPRPQINTTPMESPDLAGLRPSPKIERDDGGDGQRLTPASESPPPAVVESTEAPADKVETEASPVAKASTPSPKQTAAPDKRTRTEAPVKPGVDADGIPVVWILRVASVSSAGRADELRKRLLVLGHKAYTKKVKVSGKTLYRVYVGPKVEKAKLEQVQAQINAEFGVTTMITRYYP